MFDAYNSYYTMERANSNTQEVPKILGVRTKEIEPLLKAWRKKNPGVNWTYLVLSALSKELAPYAGKRYAHLIQGD